MNANFATIEQRDKVQKCLIYAFIYFLLFDGILRKWIFPSLSTPIMMVKQLLAVLICFYGLPYLSKISWWEKSFAVLGVLTFITTLLFGHQNLVVALYGCLPYWFGLPLSFIIGKVFDFGDLYRIGKIIIYTSLVNSLLIILQFCLPVDNFFNRQGADIDYNLVNYSVASLQGGFRPSGLFVYNTQNSLFILLSLAFILFYYRVHHTISQFKYVLIAALIFNILSLPFTVSRTTIFYEFGFFLYYFIFCLSRKKKYKLLRYSPIILLIFVLISFVPIVRLALETIMFRFQNASEALHQGSSTVEGTILDIFYRGFIYNFDALFNPRTLDGESVPFFGFGQGMSTQVGGRLLGLNKHSGFVLAEWDGLRIICESGILLGWIIILIRLGYSFRYLFCLRRLQKHHKLMSIMLLPTFLISFYLLNTWGNLFQSNFAFLSGGLFLASLKYRFCDISQINSKN